MRSKSKARSKKDRASQKQRSEFLAAPVHKAPPGRQKSEREFCLFGGVLFVRRAAPYGRLVAFSKPAAVWPVGFCAWCFGVFSVGVPLPCSRPVGCPPFFVWPALPACRLAVVGFVSGLQAACRFCANFCARCLVCPPCALCAHFRLVLAVCSPVLCCVRGFSLLSFAFFCLTSFSQTSFHLSLRPRRALPRLSPPAALFPACGSCYLLLFRGLLRPLPVCLFCVVYAGFLSFVFHLFLPNFFLSKLFSFVAQAATGISLLVPSRGFVSGLRVLSPAAFSRTFAPIACLPVLRCLCEFSLLFFCPFLPNFFLSNFFSFVAQAATGLYFLPKRK